MFQGYSEEIQKILKKENISVGQRITVHKGREIFEGVLWPRQSKTLTGLDMAWVKVGNAGGLDISWKGKSIGPIGEAGEVRVVVFSADDVEVLPPGRSL